MLFLCTSTLVKPRTPPVVTGFGYKKRPGFGFRVSGGNPVLNNYSNIFYRNFTHRLVSINLLFSIFDLKFCIFKLSYILNNYSNIFYRNFTHRPVFLPIVLFAAGENFAKFMTKLKFLMLFQA